LVGKDEYSCMKSSPKAIFRTYGAQVCTLNCHMLTKSRLKVYLSRIRCLLSSEFISQGYQPYN